MDKAVDGTYYCLFRSLLEKEELKEVAIEKPKPQESASSLFDFFDEPKK